MSDVSDIHRAEVSLRPNIERAEYFAVKAPSTEFGVVQKPLTSWEKLYNKGSLRKIAILILLAVIWEIYGRWLNNPLLFPTFSSVIVALVAGIVSGGLIGK
ncbi:ABC transporter permease, partial [Glaciimonas sp. CA11.2]|nr:ABC transporter permease [Glaciimonas sp. CA11.2]